MGKECTCKYIMKNPLQSEKCLEFSRPAQIKGSEWVTGNDLIK